MKEEVFNTSIRKLLKRSEASLNARLRRRCGRPWLNIGWRGARGCATKLTLSIPTVGLTCNLKGDVDTWVRNRGRTYRRWPASQEIVPLASRETEGRAPRAMSAQYYGSHG